MRPLHPQCRAGLESHSVGPGRRKQSSNSEVPGTMLHGRASSLQPVRLRLSKLVVLHAGPDRFSNLFICALFEDTPFLVDITDAKPVKRVLPSNPLMDDSLSSKGGKHTTCAAIFSLHGNHILTGTNKGYINIIETETRKIIHSTKVSSGLITLLRLSSNGRSLLVNSTDRIIRVINLPDLTQIRPSNAVATQDEDIDPGTLADNITLSVEHKFQDLVNRLRWNHTTFSHSSSNSSSDYVTASTVTSRLP
jgi:COMPASS component SWD1